MEIDPEGRAGDQVRESRAELRRALRRRPLPVGVLAAPGDLPALRLGGWETSDGAVTCVRVDYGDRVSVETARWSGARVESGPLREILEHAMRTHGERFSDVEWISDDRAMTVDGRVVAGRRLRAGDRWWVVRCSLRDLEISVVARDWPLPVAVRTLSPLEVDDLVAVVSEAPHRRGGAVVPAQGETPEPEREPGEPHRVLVEAVLRSEHERSQWVADGGPPPRLPRYWSSLWRDAVRRQSDLAGQDEAEAQKALQGIVNQLTALHHEAEWFRTDEGLRRRAISETLLFGTGLGPEVPSRPAQVAWLRRQGMRPTEFARLEAIATSHGYWLDEWNTWARDRAPQP